ncbi:MAG: SRPBCC family protein [Acidimicrobiia bacterium]
MPTDGTLEEIDGRYVLRFERRLGHPVERVWDALTRPERLAEWFGSDEIELDLVEGGRFDVRTTGPPELVEAIIREAGEEALMQHNTILRLERPLLFEHTFGDPDSIARWELQRDGDGCRLILTHTEPAGFDAADAPRDLGGWHTLLDLMEQALAGEPVEWTSQRWEQHRDRYAATLGSAE